MELFYIKNRVDDSNTRITGYFSSLDKAQEALKTCSDWFRNDGTGEIYQTDMDVLETDSILVCKDGSLITPSNELSEAMKKVFSEMSASDIINWGGNLNSFHYYVLQNPCLSPAVSELKEYILDKAFSLCFYNTKKEYEEKNPSVDKLISQATLISEQSKELADDLSKFQDGYVLGLAESEFEMG